MCNIAGYIGKKNAVPILIEMLKNQETFDGGLSTGIATIHEGKLYSAKVLGNVETLIRETDALNFPGTTGIIHSRPGNDFQSHAHPYICGNSALVLNGTLRGVLRTEREKNWSEVSNMLFDNGYKFTSLVDLESGIARLKANSKIVHPTEVLLGLENYYAEKGMPHSKALARAASTLTSESVSVLINADNPDKIFVTRITRPMCVGVHSDETYIASTELGFPKDITFDHVASLPTCRACEITPGGYTVTPYKVEGTNVERITPEIYYKAYGRICEALKNESMNFDMLERLAYRNWMDLWDKESEFTQYAALVYELLTSLMAKNKLSTEIKMDELGRDLTYFRMK